MKHHFPSSELILSYDEEHQIYKILIKDLLVDSVVNWQTRNFNMSTPRGGVQTDLTPTGKDAGAKIGKASADAIDEFFSKYQSKLGVVRPINAGKDPHIPAVGKWDKVVVESK